MTKLSNFLPRGRRSIRLDFLYLVVMQPLWAIPFALFFGTLFGARLHDYLLAYQVSVVFSYCIGLALWATRHGLVERVCGPNPQRSIRTGLFMVGGATVGSYVAAFIVHFTLIPGFMGGIRQVVISGMFTLLFGTLFTGINYAVFYYREAIERARAVEQMRAQLAEAELRALRAQIHPHFLFNTLNAIASLIGSNPAAAEDMTTRLADVFRYALRASEREQTRLADELDFLRSYLAIEHTRFGERLRVEERIESGLEHTMVPSLLLQPVVENAVQYAVSSRTEGATIRISARRESGRVVIEVADDGPGMDGSAAPSGTGFGLHSVRERLRAAGLADALEIDSAPGRGTRVRITLPDESTPPSPPHLPGGPS